VPTRPQVAFGGGGDDGPVVDAAVNEAHGRFVDVVRAGGLLVAVVGDECADPVAGQLEGGRRGFVDGLQ
jgi:hypothetical protein